MYLTPICFIIFRVSSMLKLRNEKPATPILKSSEPCFVTNWADAVHVPSSSAAAENNVMKLIFFMII